MPLIVALAGCARGEVGGGGGDGGGTGSDGSMTMTDGQMVMVDAAVPVDAAVTKTLTQSNSTAVVATQIGCQQTNPATSYTRENSYYRVFPLADHQITTAFHITQVTFQVERATAPAGNQPATVKLGTYAGTIGATTLNTAQVTPLGQAAITIPNGATSVVTPVAMFTPSSIIVPAGSNLIAEVLIPDGLTAQAIFFIGSNNGGETRPSYIRAPICNFPNPSTYATVGQPQVQILLSVTGTH
jgi:hypothetical protein